MKVLPLSFAALLVATAGVMAAGKVKSGLEPGSKVGAYNVLDITGPFKDKKLCYR